MLPSLPYCRSDATPPVNTSELRGRGALARTFVSNLRLPVPLMLASTNRVLNAIFHKSCRLTCPVKSLGMLNASGLNTIHTKLRGGGERRRQRANVIDVMSGIAAIRPDRRIRHQLKRTTLSFPTNVHYVDSLHTSPLPLTYQRDNGYQSASLVGCGNSLDFTSFFVFEMEVVISLLVGKVEQDK